MHCCLELCWLRGVGRWRNLLLFPFSAPASLRVCAKTSAGRRRASNKTSLTLSRLTGYLFTVAQIFNLPYRRFVIGGPLLAGGMWQVKNLRYSPARRSRNQRSAGLVRGQ